MLHASLSCYWVAWINSTKREGPQAFPAVSFLVGSFQQSSRLHHQGQGDAQVYIHVAEIYTGGRAIIWKSKSKAWDKYMVKFGGSTYTPFEK